jgi:hypothetical protein
MEPESFTQHEYQKHNVSVFFFQLLARTSLYFTSHATIPSPALFCITFFSRLLNVQGKSNSSPKYQR